MPELAHFMLDVLALIGGGRGLDIQHITPHLLAAILLGGMCIFISIAGPISSATGSITLTSCFAIAFISELTLLFTSGLDAGEFALHPVFNSLCPPLQEAFSVASYTLLAATFLEVISRQRLLAMMKYG